jgi:UDP-N-acetylglucosamine 4,6-dehydratase
LDAGPFYVVKPETDWWDGWSWSHAAPVPDGFRYSSDANDQWLTVEDLRALAADR